MERIAAPRVVTERDSDVLMAVRRLRRLVEEHGALEEAHALVHEGAPISKARARWSGRNHRTYTPPEVEGAEEELAWRFREVMLGQKYESGSVAIVAIFYRPNRQRIDADNLMKLVMDAATGAGVWTDDSQVTALASYVELDHQRPRTVVAWGPTSSTIRSVKEAP